MTRTNALRSRWRDKPGRFRRTRSGDAWTTSCNSSAKARLAAFQRSFSVGLEKTRVLGLWSRRFVTIAVRVYLKFSYGSAKPPCDREEQVVFLGGFQSLQQLIGKVKAQLLDRDDERALDRSLFS